MEYLKRMMKRSLKLAEAGRIIEKTDDVNLNHLIKEVAQATVPEKITFMADNLPTSFSCDREKVRQIFKNLLENAVIHGKPTKIEVKHNASDNGASLLIVNDGNPLPAGRRTRK